MLNSMANLLCRLLSSNGFKVHRIHRLMAMSTVALVRIIRASMVRLTIRDHRSRLIKNSGPRSLHLRMSNLEGLWMTHDRCHTAKAPRLLSVRR